MKELIDLIRRVAILEKRVSGMIRHGPVEEVNADEGWVRLNFGEGDNGPLLSPKIPYAQMAGALKVHAPPTKGQQMTSIAPGGDVRQAVALPMTWSDHNKSPSNKADENVVTFGAVTLKLGPDWIEITIDGFSMVISGNGLHADGAQITHDGLNIGSSHRHSGIERGSQNTNPPNP